MRDALLDAARLGGLIAPLGLATLAIAQTGDAPPDPSAADPASVEALAYDLPADGAHDAGRPEAFEVDPGLLMSGFNLLTIQGHNQAIDDDDFTLNATLHSNLATYIEAGDPWYYLEGVEAPGADWNELRFDHSDWNIGLSSFGYGGAHETVLAEMAGRHLTLYLAKPFEVTDLDRITELTLEVDYDDGFAAFLNGHLIAQANVGGIDPAVVAGAETDESGVGGAIATLEPSTEADPTAVDTGRAVAELPLPSPPAPRTERGTETSAGTGSSAPPTEAAIAAVTEAATAAATEAATQAATAAAEAATVTVTEAATEAATAAATEAATTAASEAATAVATEAATRAATEAATTAASEAATATATEAATRAATEAATTAASEAATVAATEAATLAATEAATAAATEAATTKASAAATVAATEAATRTATEAATAAASEAATAAATEAATRAATEAATTAASEAATVAATEAATAAATQAVAAATAPQVATVATTEAAPLPAAAIEAVTAAVTEAATAAATEAASWAVTEAATGAVTEAATAAVTEAATAAVTEAASLAAAEAAIEAATAAATRVAAAAMPAAIAGSQPTPAPTTEVTTAPVVLEGVAAAGGSELAAEAGITILRGSAVGPKQVQSTGTGKQVRVVGGRRIWTIDPATETVQSCGVRRTTTVGVREVRCTKGSIGRYRRGFGRSFKP